MNGAVALKENTNNSIRTYKYDSHVKPRLNDIYEWVKQGYTDYSIADSLDISRDSLIKYRNEIPELSTVFIRARAERNNLVMNRMFSKACGEKVAVIKEKVAAGGVVVELKEETYIPPDVNAADLYLRNNSDEYKSAKADNTGFTLIQNNINLPQLQDQLKQIEDELKKLDVVDSTYTEVE